MASRQGGSGAGNAPDTGSQGAPEPRDAAPFSIREARRKVESRRATERPPTRDPSAYALTDHFRERLAQPGRYVSIPIVSDAIRHGQLRWNTSDGWRFALVRAGVRYVVVVSDTDTGSPVVVTAWTEIADWNEAISADRWTPTDVHTIQLRADLSEFAEQQIPGRIRPRAIERPFEIGHHRVASEPGARYLECLDCNGRFRSKTELTQKHCRRR